MLDLYIVGHVLVHVPDITKRVIHKRKLTPSSAASTPVLCVAVVRTSYSFGSIWSSRRTGKVVRLLNFLILVLRLVIVPGFADGGRKVPEKPGQGKINSCEYETRPHLMENVIFEMRKGWYGRCFDGQNSSSR